MKPLIFLDFDGVFITGNYIVNRYYQTKGNSCSREFDPQTVKNFNYIIERFDPDPDIVISSTWRMGRSIEELQELMDTNGFVNARVVGKTEYLGKIRGEEIQKYLNQLGEKPKFCIIDDDADMGNLMPYLIKTDFKTGFNKSAQQQTIQFLIKNHDYRKRS